MTLLGQHTAPYNALNYLVLQALLHLDRICNPHFVDVNAVYDFYGPL